MGPPTFFCQTTAPSSYIILILELIRIQSPISCLAQETHQMILQLHFCKWEAWFLLRPPQGSIQKNNKVFLLLSLAETICSHLLPGSPGPLTQWEAATDHCCINSKLICFMEIHGPYFSREWRKPIALLPAKYFPCEGLHQYKLGSNDCIFKIYKLNIANSRTWHVDSLACLRTNHITSARTGAK